jgi:hypothetical protein
VLFVHTYSQRGKVALKRLLIVGALAAASAFPFAFSAHAQSVGTPIGTLTVNGTGPSDGYVEANGADSNPCPLGGYLAADSNGVQGSAATGTGYGRGTNAIIPPSGATPTAPC